MTCQNPRPTRRVINPGTGPVAYCPTCHRHVPAHQVPWGQELRNGAGSIVASYAPIPHNREG